MCLRYHRMFWNTIKEIRILYLASGCMFPIYTRVNGCVSIFTYTNVDTMYAPCKTLLFAILTATTRFPMLLIKWKCFPVRVFYFFLLFFFTGKMKSMWSGRVLWIKWMIVTTWIPYRYDNDSLKTSTSNIFVFIKLRVLTPFNVIGIMREKNKKSIFHCSYKK